MFFKKNYKYKDLDDYNLGSILKLKIDNDLIPQGICYVLPYIIITCYSINERKSRVLFFDENSTLYKSIELENRSHVGGICYDKIHEVLFICDSKGRISSYKYQEFIKGNLSSKESFKVADNTLGGGLLVEKEKYVCSYLTYFEGKIYVGSFNKNRNGLVKIFDIKRNSAGISLEYVDEFIVPSKIQGLAFYRYNQEVYLFLSRSYTRVKDSSILIYKYLKDVKDYTNSSFILTLPPMLEQITLNNKNNILLLFESFAKKYSYNAKVVIDDVYALNTLEIIDKFKNICEK